MIETEKALASTFFIIFKYQWMCGVSGIHLEVLNDNTSSIKLREALKALRMKQFVSVSFQKVVQTQFILIALIQSLYSNRKRYHQFKVKKIY